MSAVSGVGEDGWQDDRALRRASAMAAVAKDCAEEDVNPRFAPIPTGTQHAYHAKVLAAAAIARTVAFSQQPCIRCARVGHHMVHPVGLAFKLECGHCTGMMH